MPKPTKPSKTEEKDSVKALGLSAAIDDIRKRFGEGSIMQMGDAPIKNIDVIPTGSMSLDIALGVMGMPRGRVVEIYFDERDLAQTERTGKSEADLSAWETNRIAARLNR